MKLKNRQRVELCNTANKDFDGRQGQVIGIATEDYRWFHYIVLMDVPLPNGYDAFQITEACLKVI
mgnify:CR=1 FL=1